ncbi:uncharacterized protein MONOS_12845 [Monocercomonoides exilis]|uniref:uncharacterized protein n=1 Tax=Monocercomonoides exilis TaxID=2049356 RepID=UPI00355A0D55|nr:hypothetical protein MONOS_12845 [Monocercomonoides exilis]|eukprot:MONOS_12845.1-p1 / transcript=MONOS_12845.1 / gene=MONOS_12845 / organism=Monocercomonoides_exilis_PA203 / gene_product=unspecified product / transcript_product=unspecified product / location=Mono_scaffold00741:14964-16089(+) / protein_length=253 / sequence_SO=supercontig / SO=protein_coding / is_pseudo=false
MEDVVLSPAAIALAVLEEREEAEGEEMGEEKGEEKGEEDEGRDRGDGNEEKGRYPTAHREHAKRIKENQGKLEEAMASLVAEALELSGLRFEKARSEAEADKKYSVESENELAMNEKEGKEGCSIDLEKEEEEEEGQILDVESLLSVPAHPECVTLVDESACGSWRDYLVTMNVEEVLVELCTEGELIVGEASCGRDNTVGRDDEASSKIDHAYYCSFYGSEYLFCLKIALFRYVEQLWLIAEKVGRNALMA